MRDLGDGLLVTEEEWRSLLKRFDVANAKPDTLAAGCQDWPKRIRHSCILCLKFGRYPKASDFMDCSHCPAHDGSVERAGCTRRLWRWARRQGGFTFDVRMSREVVVIRDFIEYMQVVALHDALTRAPRVNRRRRLRRPK